MKNWLFFCLLLCLPSLLSAQNDSINYASIDHWETAIYPSDEWHYYLGERTPPTDWNEIPISNFLWQTGPGGIGYGDEDDGTEIDPIQSIFIRRNFNISDLSKIEGAFLDADYDDAFVAYLNGVEIARSSNIEGSPPRFFDWAVIDHEATMYWGGDPERFIVGHSTLHSLLKNGDNVLAIQVHNHNGATSSDMSSNFFLSFGINDESTFYGPTPDWFEAPESFGPITSHLPIVKIYANEILDEPKLPGRLEIVWNGPGSLNASTQAGNEYVGNIGIELRGQSSQFFFDKKSYGIETWDENGMDLDTSFLGFPAEEDWVLYGPFSDKTFLRNVLAMDLARKMGQYASRTRFVEVMLNDEYQGIFVLMEKVKRDKNRVDIANLREDDIEGEELTGGYVFKIDKGVDQDWDSSFPALGINGAKIQYQYVSPNRDKIQPEQEAYIQSYVDSFERAINIPQYASAVKHYREFIDYKSFAENFIHVELAKDVDAYRISCFFHKKKITQGGKIFAGPVWDYNLSFGNAEFCNITDPTGWIYYENCALANYNWYDQLLQDEEFTSVLKCRWDKLRVGPLHEDSIFQFIDNQIVELGPAIDQNYEKWPILNEYVWPNPVITGSFEGEIDFMKNYISERLEWMDANMIGECRPSSTTNHFSNNLQIFPNPSDGVFKFSNSNIQAIQVFNVTGKLMLNSTLKSNELDLSTFQKGIYFLKIESQNGEIITKRVIKN